MALATAGTAFGQFARAGSTYIAGRAVQALANRVENTIMNTTPQEVNSALSRLAPGKRNKNARSAARKLVMARTRGFGTITAPAAIARPAPRFKPQFNSIRGRYQVANKEFIANLQPDSTGTAINVTEYNAQVGLAEMFPWLSTIANTHQRYVMRKLRFEYVPVAGTTTRGRVVMAFSIDPTEAAPSSMSQITQYPNYVANSVWTPNTLTVDLSDRRDELYTRSGFVADTDIKTYDLGKLFVGISDTENTESIGQLFVDYEVELITPKPTNCPSSSDVFQTSSSTNIFGLEDGTTAPLVGSNIEVSRDGSVNRLKFRAPGIYLVSIVSNSSGGIAELFLSDSNPDNDVVSIGAWADGNFISRLYRINVLTASNAILTAVGLTRITVRTAMFTERTIIHP